MISKDTALNPNENTVLFKNITRSLHRPHRFNNFQTKLSEAWFLNWRGIIPIQIR